MKVLLANELRIGNLLYNDNVIVKIDARSIFDIWDDKGIKNYKPILLTEEWMVKFGYVIQPWGYVKEKSPLIRFSLTPKEKYWIEFGNGFIINLPHVHTLQNFIQLTGEELTLNKTNDK